MENGSNNRNYVAKRSISDLSRVNTHKKRKAVKIADFFKDLVRKDNDTIIDANGFESVRVKRHMDYWFLVIVLVLVGLGTIMVFSASYPYAETKTGDSLYYLKKHILFVVGGVAGMIVVSFIPAKLYKKLSGAVYAVAMLLLMAVLVIGTKEGVAKRWIIIGPLSIQPSEIGKLAIVIALAWYIEKYKKEIDNREYPRFKENKKEWLAKFLFRVGGPLIIIGAVCFFILLESHLSGTIIAGLIGIIIILIGGVDAKKSLLTTFLLGGLAVGAFLIISPYAIGRITSMFTETSNIQGDAWQTTQGIYAIGSGGFLGVGLGNSRLKYSYIYGSHTDFIFSIWCEEMGFVGAITLIVLYSLLIIRGFKIAKEADSLFSSLLGYGIITHMALQVVINIAVVTGLFPNTGVTLPFFSYGGSSTLMMLAEMGIMLQISRYTTKRIEV